MASRRLRSDWRGWRGPNVASAGQRGVAECRQPSFDPGTDHRPVCQARTCSLQVGTALANGGGSGGVMCGVKPVEMKKQGANGGLIGALPKLEEHAAALSLVTTGPPHLLSATCLLETAPFPVKTTVRLHRPCRCCWLALTSRALHLPGDLSMYVRWWSAREGSSQSECLFYPGLLQPTSAVSISRHPPT